jgi:hypothetical protein
MITNEIKSDFLPIFSNATLILHQDVDWFHILLIITAIYV